MAILVIYSGFSEPCDRCMVNLPGTKEMVSCQFAFNQRIDPDMFDLSILNSTNLSIDTSGLRNLNNLSILSG
jgi:hypothetical protein